jgi:1,2-diacylglycerol 3-beta-galactosyltransferase
VLIVYAKTGGGHESVTRALTEAILQVSDGPIKVDQLDVYDPSCSRFPLTALPHLYQSSVTRFPSAFRAFYAALADPGRFAVFERMFQWAIQPGLQRQLARLRPDIVVRVIPALGGSVSRALIGVGSSAASVVVVTDLISVHPAWVSGTASAYIVPTPEAAADCARAGIPPERTHCSGLPVPAAFSHTTHREELRRQLGLDSRRQTVLLMSGSEGAGRQDVRARAVASSCPGAHLVVVCGLNERLRRRLVADAASADWTILGHVDNIAEWMRASDLLVTKAGPSTVMEAIHTGLPMILIDSLPQELATEAYLRAHGAAEVAASPAEAAATAADLLRRPERLETLRRAGAALRRPTAARDAADLILRSAARR